VIADPQLYPDLPLVVDGMTRDWATLQREPEEARG
jgi:hypothetical protein